MSAVYERRGKYYLRFKDARDRWRAVASTARTKTEARRLADDLERKAERQRLGLEPMELEDGGGTLGELVTWWVKEYFEGTPPRVREGFTRQHELSAAFFLQALVATARHANASWFERRRLAWKASLCLKKLHVWANNCPENHASYYKIVAAEVGRVRGRADEAEHEYAHAIQAAREHPCAKREALALELAARFFRGRGRTADADAHLRDAIAAYRRWGATAKGTALEAELCSSSNGRG